MRNLLIVSTLALSACALSACATQGPPGSAQSELARLTADCRARGGILVPSGRPLEGRPSVDNFCQIRGATRTSPGGAG